MWMRAAAAVAVVFAAVVVCGGVGVGAVTWSPSTGYNALMYAYAAYCPPASIAEWNNRYAGQHGTGGFVTTHVFQNTSMETLGYAGVHEPSGTAVISFRGTVMDDLRDWIIDINCGKTDPYPGVPDAKVATGFYHAYMGLRPQVTAAIADLVREHSPASFLVTGHSLGAALSLYAALDVDAATSGAAKLSVVNFGDPRVGNAAFAAHYEDRIGHANTLRVTWKADIVPHLPPQAFGFHHVGTEVWGHQPTKDGPTVYTVCNGSGEDPECSDSVSVPDSVYDHLHYMGVYEDCTSSSSSSSSSGSGSGSGSGSSSGSSSESGSVPQVYGA